MRLGACAGLVPVARQECVCAVSAHAMVVCFAVLLALVRNQMRVERNALRRVHDVFAVRFSVAEGFWLRAVTPSDKPDKPAFE